MRISDWSSDVCSSDLDLDQHADAAAVHVGGNVVVAVDADHAAHLHVLADLGDQLGAQLFDSFAADAGRLQGLDIGCAERGVGDGLGEGRSEEHTSELQPLMSISYAVFCLKKKKKPTDKQTHNK